ncbi:hypothetical protein fugu_004838 [Takifugu bimaculatus]|uniref:Inter-alpha-trypsin inhibitor heavy chain H3 n=1 Tax=Takifugu bimaculatus TaxID=433685 RepID=A0A4Z2B831_9TELE|nr:hypothetical protein fugu_004838 [Takifugu bimaculatus]
MAYVKNIAARGGTDINDSVLKAVDMLVTDREAKRLPEKSIDMIILLTDGDPTSGEIRVPVIQENVRNAIGGNMSLYGLGFGNDVDYAFLDVMSRENKGPSTPPTYFGQFYHGIEYEVSDLRPGEVPEKPDATMFVKGQQLNVTRADELALAKI